MGLIPPPCIQFCLDNFSPLSSVSTITSHDIYGLRTANHAYISVNPGRYTAYASYGFHSSFPKKALSWRSFSSRNRQVPSVTKNSGPREEDRRALEVVLRLYSALEHRNLRELSDVIADECRCVCNFISCFHPFHGKKQVLELFSFLMRTMGDNIEFVVQPTMHGGMQVGVRWKLEWQTTNVPLGKGFSFYTCHAYQGKVVISNMEMFMEPLLHLEPFRLKMMGLVMPVLDKIGSYSIIKVKGKRAMYIFLILVIIVSILCFLKISSF